MHFHSPLHYAVIMVEADRTHEEREDKCPTSWFCGTSNEPPGHIVVQFESWRYDISAIFLPLCLRGRPRWENLSLQAGARTPDVYDPDVSQSETRFLTSISDESVTGC